MTKSVRNTTIRKKKKANQTACYSAKGVEATRLRRRRRVLAVRFGIPDQLLGGSLNQVFRKCGKPTCHCVLGDGHPMWTLTYSVAGNRRVEFIPDDLVPLLEPLAEEGRAYKDALNELRTINAQLVSLWRKNQRAGKKMK